MENPNQNPLPDQSLTQAKKKRVMRYIYINMALIGLLNIMFIIYGIVVIKNLETIAHPYFGILLLTIIINIFEFPCVFVFHKVSRTELDQVLNAFRLQLLMLGVQTVISIFCIAFPLLKTTNIVSSIVGEMVYLLLNEVIRLIHTLITTGVFIYVKRNHSLNSLLAESYTSGYLQQFYKQQKEKEQKANEIIDKIPDVNLEDPVVVEELKTAECVICLDIVMRRCEQPSAGSVENPEEIDQRIKILSCLHTSRNYFHRKCLYAWFKQKIICPMCKNDNILETHLLEGELFQVENNVEPKDELRIDLSKVEQYNEAYKKEGILTGEDDTQRCSTGTSQQKFMVVQL